jgi:hypothetical protein
LAGIKIVSIPIAINIMVLPMERPLVFAKLAYIDQFCNLRLVLQAASRWYGEIAKIFTVYTHFFGKYDYFIRKFATCLVQSSPSKVQTAGEVRFL